MPGTLTPTQTLPFTIAYVDAAGAPTVPAAGTVTVTTSDLTVATVSNPSADGQSGTVAPLKAGPDTLVASTAAGPIPLTGGDFTVTAPLPTAGTVTFGTATP
jgi:hypothetical protein